MARLSSLKSGVAREILFTIFIVSSFGAVACSNTTNRDLAEAAVTEFHKQLDAAQYDRMIREGDKEFQGNEADTKDFLKEVHDVLGKVKSTNQAAGSVQNMSDEAVITLTYSTAFQNGGASETFVYRVKDRKAKLIFYDAKAPGVRNRD